MTSQEILVTEDYKKRISDLVDELEKEIGLKIQSVDITQKQDNMLTRGVKFHVEF